jgi:heme/copper-type cytochrome/quinol oxidase subunit 2
MCLIKKWWFNIALLVNSKGLFLMNFFQITVLKSLDAPLPWQMNFQQPATPTMEGIVDLHHNIMFFMIFIVIFISYILIRAVYLFNEDKVSIFGPVSNTRHFLLLEVIWTIIPLVILFWIALPSFALLYSIDHCPKIELTIKVIGRQWYWTYEIDAFRPNPAKFESGFSFYKTITHYFNLWLDMLVDHNTKVEEQFYINYNEFVESESIFDSEFDALACIMEEWTNHVAVRVMYFTANRYRDAFIIGGNLFGPFINYDRFVLPINHHTVPPKFHDLYAKQADDIGNQALIDMTGADLEVCLRVPATVWDKRKWGFQEWLIQLAENSTGYQAVWFGLLYESIYHRFGSTVFKNFDHVDTTAWTKFFWHYFSRNRSSLINVFGIYPFLKDTMYNPSEEVFSNLKLSLWNIQVASFINKMETFALDTYIPELESWNIEVKDFFERAETMIMLLLIHDYNKFLTFSKEVAVPLHFLVEFDSCIVSDKDVYDNFVWWAQAPIFPGRKYPQLAQLPTKFCGWLRLLEVDRRLVLPIKTKIRILVTSSDVIHSWAVPSLGVKIDACPGRLNCVYVFIKRPGVFHGQCSELCGVKHGFMPIVVHAVTKEKYRRWFNNNAELVNFY